MDPDSYSIKPGSATPKPRMESGDHRLGIGDQGFQQSQQKKTSNCGPRCVVDDLGAKCLDLTPKSEGRAASGIQPQEDMILGDLAHQMKGHVLHALVKLTGRKASQ